MCDNPKNPGDPANDRLVTVAEAAKVLACSPRQVWRYGSDNQPEADRLPLVRLGKNVTRVSMRDLQAFIARHRR